MTTETDGIFRPDSLNSTPCGGDTTELSQQGMLIESLTSIVGPEAVLSSEDELLVYECDALPHHKHRPRAVVFPSSTENVAAIMKVLMTAEVPFTPRGAGTGYSGGALPLNRGVIIESARMRRILNIDSENRTVVVQPGVINLHISRATERFGLHYVPDPSSQPTCTIGGNIAENAGGIHCLKYGTTTDHVLEVKVVLGDGSIVKLGGVARDQTGYDLLGVFVGSEGTFGVVTEATLRLVPIPPAVRTMLADFSEVNSASHAVSAIIAAGVMPAALEMMDGEIIRAVEASVFAAGLPVHAGAALLIELDGIEAGLDEEAERVRSICLQYGARDCRTARDENERNKLWAARKGAFGAMGRISPDIMIQDAVVPRSQLPAVLNAVYEIAAQFRLRIANVFHAGDGNLHPLMGFDSRSPEEVLRVKEAGRKLIETCVRAGGTITGEHGVGFDKRELLSLIFSDADMDAMLRVRAAFDPTGLCNPGKIIPMLRGCGEARATSNVQLQATSNVQRQATSNVQRPMSNVLSAQEAAAPEVKTASTVSDPETARHRLVQLVAEENISASPRVSFSPSALTVSPDSIAEVCEVMKLASSEGWAVVPAGAMTWLDAGQRMNEVQLVLSTRRLNRIVEHEPADLIAVTEAGVTLENFNLVLAQNGQWLPLDPPDDARATIGGIVATGLGGAHQFGYGAPRRHVIGMKVVLADGTLIKVGGRVVKNVAGYDLCKLFTGSYGTLGIIVEVNFKLRPLPFETRSMLVSGEREALLHSAREIIRSRLFPVAVELLSPAMARVAGFTENARHLLMLKFDGSSSAVTQQVSSACELTSNTNGGPPRVVVNDDECWRRLASLPLQFERDLVWRAGLPPADVPTFLAYLEGHSSNSQELMWQASLGEGRVRVIEQLPPKDELSEPKRDAVTRLHQFRSKAERQGGTLTIELAPAEIKRHISTWGNFGSAARVMQRIKQQLDPQAILSPDRFGFEKENE